MILEIFLTYYDVDTFLFNQVKFTLLIINTQFVYFTIF